MYGLNTTMPICWQGEALWKYYPKISISVFLDIVILYYSSELTLVQLWVSHGYQTWVPFLVPICVEFQFEFSVVQAWIVIWVPTWVPI